MTSPEDNITALLQQIRQGDAVAHDKVSRLVYGELKKIARGQMRGERPNHTLQPTAIVNEMYMKLLGKTPMEFQDRRHFYKVAANQMRRFLFDYARARNGPERRRDLAVWVPEELLASPEARDALDANIAIHDLLDRLRRENPQAAEVVDLKFFTGLTDDEEAALLKTSKATVRRRWTSALKWLVQNMKGSPKAGADRLRDEDSSPETHSG